MGSLSIVHWLIVLAAIFVLAFPLVRILRRLGYSGWWAVLWFVPLVNLIALWVLAYRPWPRDAASN
jgi:predicted ABC-type exoprotein transport system permease subunit